MERVRRHKLSLAILSLALAAILLLAARGAEISASVETAQPVSDHFDGKVFFNPGFLPAETSAQGTEPRRRGPSWIWRWLFGTDWPEWPETNNFTPGPSPLTRVPKGALHITPVGHSTFLVQMDGVNILTDPIWSDRCSPVSWAGPKRYVQPGIRFERPVAQIPSQESHMTPSLGRSTSEKD